MGEWWVGGGPTCFRESKDLFNHEWMLFTTNGKIKYCQFVLLPKPLGSLQLSTGQEFWKLWGEQIYRSAGQWGKCSSCPAPRGSEPRRFAREAAPREGCTYRKISDNGSRVICSKREGEQFQKRGQWSRREIIFAARRSIFFPPFPKRAITLMFCLKYS